MVLLLALMAIVAPSAGAATATSGSMFERELCVLDWGYDCPNGSTLADDPSYQGWTTVIADTIYNTCSTGQVCAAWYSRSSDTVTAWQWVGGSWHEASFTSGERVYAWPYASGWHWAWTRRTGWLAIRSSSLRAPARAPACLSCVQAR